MSKRNTQKLKRKASIRKSPSVNKNIGGDLKPPRSPVHSWRVCPYGEHWVRTHPMHVPPSKNHPEGSVATRHEHCARNPSGKDQLYPDEIQEIASQNFANLKNKPCPRSLIFGVDGNKYDDLIAGWTQYWNEVLKPATWAETIWEYKAVKRAKTKEDAERIKKTFNKFYEELKKCGKP